MGGPATACLNVFGETQLERMKAGLGSRNNVTTG
jgi:hypothetical protein